MGIDYSSYVNQIATLAVVPTTDADFQSIIPSMISYAELRIQRDLDLFASTIVNTAYSTTPGYPYIDIQHVDFITIQNIIVTGISPNVVLSPTTKEFLQSMYPIGTQTGTPKYFSLNTSNTSSTIGGGSSADGAPSFSIYLGPIPDISYTLSIYGNVHMNPLSATNTTTWISTYLPDLFIMASMVYISGYQRNFGSQSDDPRMAQSYESQYNSLLQSAAVEEIKKKMQMSTAQR